MNFDDANAYCQGLNGNLVGVANAEKYNEVYAWIKQHSGTFWTGMQYTGEVS